MNKKINRDTLRFFLVTSGDCGQAALIKADKEHRLNKFSEDREGKDKREVALATLSVYNLLERIVMII